MARFSEVLSLGDLPPGLSTRIEERTGRAVRAIDQSEVADYVTTAKVLIVGHGLEPDELSVILSAVRDSAPSLTVIGIEQEDMALAASTRSKIDTLYAFPQQQERLIADIAVELQTRRFRLGYRARQAGQALLGAALVAGVILAWHQVTVAGLLPPYVLPGPERVWSSFVERWDSFLYHTGITGAEAFAGFILGNVIGITTTVVLFRFSWLRSLSLPLITGLQAIPIIAIAPLLAIWLGSGGTAKVAMAAIVCLFPVISNLLTAFAAVDRELAQLFVFHRASYFSTLSRLLIPASYPAILAGLRISGGLAVVGAIVAEFTGADRGLGYLLLNATYRLQTDVLFVAILLSAFLGVIFANLPNVLRWFGVGRTYVWKVPFRERA